MLFPAVAILNESNRLIKTKIKGKNYSEEDAVALETSGLLRQPSEPCIAPCEIRNPSVCATVCTLGSVASVQEIRGLLLVWMWLAVSLEILSVFRGYRT